MTDDLNDTVNAPLRPIPGALPAFDTFANTRKRLHALIEQLAKANDKREEAIAKLIRADAKVRDLRRAVARTSKRLTEGQKDE